MKKIFILLITCILCFAGCSNVGSKPTSPPTENSPSPPLESVTPSKPNLPNNSGEDKPTLAPTRPIKYDELLQIHTTSLILFTGENQTGKKVGTVYKNDLLPILDVKNGHYVSVFNYNTVLIPTYLNVSVKKFAPQSDKVEKVISEGKKLIGVPYVYGAERYHWGNGILNQKFSKYAFDCSSFTQYAFFKGSGILLDTTSRAQSGQGKTVSKNALRRGDLLFFTTPSRANLSGTEKIGHVAIYLGDNYILHTASDYAIIEPISAKRWNSFVTAKRVIFD